MTASYTAMMHVAALTIGRMQPLKSFTNNFQKGEFKKNWPFKQKLQVILIVTVAAYNLHGGPIKTAHF